MYIDNLAKTNPDRTRRIQPLIASDMQSDVTKDNSRKCPEYERGNARKEMFLGKRNVMCDLQECPYGYNSKGFFEDEDNEFNICQVQGYIGKHLDVKI